METFVRYIVAGGLAMVAGLWLVDGFDAGATPWFLGVALAVLGAASLLYGVADPLAY